MLKKLITLLLALSFLFFVTSSVAASTGPKTDRTNLTYTSNNITSKYHLYASGLDWTKPVGLIVYTDGSGEYGLKNPNSTYLLGGSNGLIAVAKRNNMVLLTPLAPGGGCTDGDGSCWYLPSSGITAAQKTAWSAALIKYVQSQYPLNLNKVVLAGYSSGAQWTTEFIGPRYASSLMTDGLLLAISYGGQPILTPTWTQTFKENVNVFWNVGDKDPAWRGAGRYDADSGYQWYRNAGFQTKITVVPNTTHNRSRQFGLIVENAIKSAFN